MSDKIMCAICGRMIDSNIVEYLDNGSPACPECVAEEQNIEEEKEKESNK